MRIVLLLLLALQGFALIAQPGFEKIYSQAGSLKLEEMDDHNIILGMSMGIYTADGVSIMDQSGEIIEAHPYHNEMVLGVASFQKRLGNGFYFVTGRYFGISCIHTGLYPIVGKMDTLGRVVQLKYYVMGDVCQALAIGLDVTHDNGLVTWGWKSNFFALRVDSDLNHVWSKHFDRNGGFQFIKELPGGDLLAGINMDTAGAVVARMDAAGNFLWCKSYIRPSGLMHDCIVENDSTFIITGVTDSLSNGGQKMFMLKLNGTGDVQWCRGYNSSFHWNANYPVRMVKANDGNYVLLARSGAQPVLMKTDMNGDTLWTRSAGVSGYGYETNDLLAYSDGGFLFSGIVLGDLPDMNSGLPYIFKTDSLGHLPCSEAPPPSISISELFPVDSAFTLTSTDGATAYSELVSDTTYAPVVIYDGCLLTSVSNPVGGKKPHIHPNPSSGHFTLDFPDPLTVDSFYSVYDATGRLLFQRPLSKSMEKVEIDLSSYGKGMYLIRFSDRDGVCAERVVVE